MPIFYSKYIFIAEKTMYMQENQVVIHCTVVVILIDEESCALNYKDNKNK